MAEVEGAGCSLHKSRNNGIRNGLKHIPEWQRAKALPFPSPMANVLCKQFYLLAGTSVKLASRQRHDLPGAGSGGRPLQVGDRGGKGTAPAPLVRERITAAPGTGWSNDSAS